MKSAVILPIVIALLAGAPAFADAQQPAHPAATPRAAPSYKREVSRRLLRQAKVGEDSALKIATARMPGAKVQAVELENEHGHLIWSWELKLEGKTGIEEVNVDARDGSIVGVEHEEPRSDRARVRPGTAAAPRP